ncbi:MAG: lipoyl(octanoyl) transferase LipB [Actinobacteria bacterium]|nr:lipoyl(octanoyl) transferase LipB [Actinomycetota bacterium]
MSSLRTETISVQNLGLLEYETAWQLQREIQAGVIAGVTPNTLLLLEHPPVFTAGRRTSELDRPTDGTPVINVDRGGKITWHGPGQIVGYPIVKLKNGNDVVGFVREIENALIEVCKEFGVNAERYCERTGVWIRDAKGDRKLAAIGIRVAKGVTMHGFALNVNPDLSWFTRIIPCGIPDVEVTSLSVELGRNISIVEILDSVTRNITSALGKVAE